MMAAAHVYRQWAGQTTKTHFFSCVGEPQGLVGPLLLCLMFWARHSARNLGEFY